MVEPDMVRVLGRSAFHGTGLTSYGDLCYLGGEWRREVAFAGFDVPIQMDISAEKMLFGVTGVAPERRDELIKDVSKKILSFSQQGSTIICILCATGSISNVTLRQPNSSGGTLTHEVLDVDLSWRMHKVSDGQRRRVQICMGLLKPYKILVWTQLQQNCN